MQWVAVATGGAIGAVCRFIISTYWFPVTGHRFPVGTLVVNVLGCFLVGAFYVLIVEKGLLPAFWKPFLITGFLGALTTFSTFSLDALLLWQNGLHFLAFAYVAANLLLCFIAVVASWSVFTALL